MLSDRLEGWTNITTSQTFSISLLIFFPPSDIFFYESDMDYLGSIKSSEISPHPPSENLQENGTELQEYGLLQLCTRI